MATKEQIETILEKMEQVHPSKCFRNFSDTQAGIGAVLRFLHESQKPITAGTISEYLHISTARVAVLLKKMTAKGLITKERSTADARVTMVALSESGRKIVEKMRDDAYRQIGRIIDQVGVGRLNEFIGISNEIMAVMEEPKLYF